MIDIAYLTSQVKRNCNISDAHFWGTYSLCGLLLRLRELYRAEKGMGLREKIPQKDVGEWLTERESLWRELEGKDYEEISLNGNVFGPFEAEKINAEIGKENLLYGAGYGFRMKPSFFLAELLSKQETHGYSVFVSGKEYERDLSDNPAMLQGENIFVRTGPIRLLLWQKFEELRGKRTKYTLAFAFSKYGISPEEKPSAEVDRKISVMAESEAETYIRHELGEAVEGKKIGDDWKAILMHLSNTRSEIFARAVKDILSDTSENGMLKYIIRSRKEGSLGCYLVFLGGMRKVLFPEIFEAFQKFIETKDWGQIDGARRTGYRNAVEYMEKVLSLHRTRKDGIPLADLIESELLRGLL